MEFMYAEIPAHSADPVPQGFRGGRAAGKFQPRAEEVGLTQSAISHQMRLLEGQIGQPLFLRIGGRCASPMPGATITARCGAAWN
jgi:DNA-binding transcriptional LysR family regulator